MKKVLLIDGNNLMFRSYYATIYSGSSMQNSKSFPTNALYGFVNMINKVVSEEKPIYMVVAFDMGKTFRHDNYTEYKGGREETPDDLKKQFPIAKKILDAMGICYLEKEGYEADDIIGTLAKMIDEEEEYIGTIVSSDKDLLQLISNDIDVKLLKQKDYIRMNRDVFYNTYGIEPNKMIDLKGLMGDTSDNIPGVRGIGEKTALKLLQEYDSIENIYVHIEELKGSIKEKLINEKDKAFMSKSLATIYKEVPINKSLDDVKICSENIEQLINIYNDLEFYSFLKNVKNQTIKEDIKVETITNSINLTGSYGVYIELDSSNYHSANIIGIGLYNKDNSYYIDKETLIKNKNIFNNCIFLTYDYKRLYVSLYKIGIILNQKYEDIMLSGYLLNYNVKEDIAYLSNQFGVDIPFYDKKSDYEDIKQITIQKAKFIYDFYPIFEEKMKTEEVLNLYNTIELPLSKVLSKMEINGIRINKKVFEEMKKEITIKMELTSMDIYNMVGEEFNISSPKQLGEILFDKLHLPFGKKNKTGYSTDQSVLNKLSNIHPVINKITEYRMLSKLYSTYIEGLLNIVGSDFKIHTIYTQTLTRTGRLSSIEPNLQNIPIRYEYGRLIRKGFVAEKDSLLMSSDYSQIELRIFASIAKINDMIDAFKENLDIHTHTAMDIFDVPYDLVTKDMRRKAKAVNFGILYGISSYGLSEDLHIPNKEAKAFIDKYYETYPGIKEYMTETIQKAHEFGYVKTLMNRKRIIDELNNKNHIIKSMGERMALNTPIQGTSADILKKAMIEIDEYFNNHNLKSTMLLQVHDELIFNVVNEEKEEVEKVVKNIMENSYKIDVPLIADIEFGSNWYSAK